MDSCSRVIITSMSDSGYVSGSPANFELARRRLQRATHHRDEMRELWDRTDTTRRGLRAHVEGSCVVVSAWYECDADFGEIFGNWLADVRTTLDRALFQLAISQTAQNPPTRVGDRQFPIAQTRNAWEQLLGSKRNPLHGFGDRAIEMVESMQPYNGKYGADGDGLLWMHDLARKDRHRDSFEMGGLIWNFQLTVAERYRHLLADMWLLDQESTAPVISNGGTLVLARLTGRTAEDAQALLNQAVTAEMESKLEVYEWYRDTHTKGISRNIRNDSLGTRMGFIERFLSMTIDQFETEFG